MRIIGRTLFALVMGMVVLLAVVSPQAGYAESGEEGEADSFYLLIHALRYAEEKRTYIPGDSPIVPINRSLTEWFMNEVVNPSIPTFHGHFRDKAELLGKIEYYYPNNAILETLAYLRKYDLLSVALTEALVGLYIESIAEYTDDTPETVRELLTSRVALEMSDRAALVALYNATDGDNWDDNTNWLSDLPLNYWHRIRVYAGRVTHLELSDNGLSGEIPREIGSLSELWYLDLSNNDLHGQIPFQIGHLPNLEKVRLWGNRFTGCVPGSLYDLWFSTTPAASSDNPFLYWFDDLYKLDLPTCGPTNELTALYEATDGDNWTNNTNWMSDRPVGEWHGVTTDYHSNIIRLELDDNNLSGRIPPELGGITSLKRLSLFGNRLSGEIPPELGKLSSLESLSLGGNRISGCLPEGLSDVPRIDLSALGVPFCGSGADVPAPSLALAAFSPSPTKMNLFWVNNLEAESVTIYRNGAPVAAPPLDQSYYIESGLSPNVRYQYRIEASLADRSKKTAESSSATLVYSPRMAEPMYINEIGFNQPIVDNFNPPETEYRVIVSGYSNYLHEEHVVSSDWNASRCVKFEGLKPGMRYSPEAVARNLDEVESEPNDWIYGEYVINPTIWSPQTEAGNDDPWAIYKINEAAALYGLTEAARLWMLSDIKVRFYRNEPGYGGYHINESIAGVGNASPGTVMHEVMHGFINHWTGFPQPCDVMNIYTLNRDVARFLLDFREYERLGQPNPLEDWRPFYNHLVGIQPDYSSLWGKDFWELLEQGDYHELRALYHKANAGLLDFIAGKMSLLPPILRSYFEGFLVDDSDATTWREELYWYSSLPPQERRLWDTAYNYHGVLNFSPQYAAPEYAPRTSIPAEKRELLRNADRRILVDFVNTMEDISCNTQDPCIELWSADFGYWTGYVHRNLYRARLYLEELSADTGTELAPANLEAVRGILGAIVSDVSCGSARPSYLRGYVNSAAGVSDLQRNALLAMVDVLEREPGWGLPCGSEAALAEAWPVAPHRIHDHEHRAPGG